MSLENFAKQKRETLTPETSMIADFARNEDFEIGMTESNLTRTSPIIKEKEPSKIKTGWQWLSKQLMKPVGSVAAETEQLGRLIGEKRLYVPGKAALNVLTGKKEYSFSKLWGQYGPQAGIGERTSTAIGFVFDITSDPLNFVGGGLTKLGRVSAKVSSLAKAGKTVSKTSRLGKYVAKMGYSVDDLVLAGSKVEQVTKGQRAFLQIAGKPIVGGTKIYKATERLKQIVKATKAFKAVSHPFSTRSGIKHLDELVDNFNNLSNYRKQQVVEKGIDIQTGMKKMSPREIKMVAEAIENPLTRKTIKNKEIVKIADKIDDLFKTMKRKERAVGVLKTELESYFPHIKAKGSFKSRLNYFFNPKKYSQALGQAKKRKIAGTINEINARFGKEFFESNPSVAYAQRGLASAKARTAKEFLDEVGKKFFVNAEDAPIAFMESTNPLLKGLKADPDVVRIVDQYMQGIKPDDLKLVVRGFDKVQNWWKAQALISPSYHTRNAFSNFWNNFLAGVKNPIRYSQARTVQRAAGNKKLLNKVMLVTDAGEKLTFGKVLSLSKQKGVLGRGWYGADIATQLADEVGGNTTRAKKLAKLMPWERENYLFKTNRAVGQAIEDNARIAHFIDYLKKGYSADDAARSVKKFLFDYGDLTITEKNIMKRVMPFYTWTRKNIPLQLEQLAVQPEKFAAIPKAIQAIESGVATPKTEKYLSSYITDNVPVRIRTDTKGNTEYFLIGNWLPSAQAIDFLSQPIQNITQMVTPFAKTPWELWANKSLFFKNTLGEGSKIEYYYKQPTEFVGVTMRRKQATLLRNIRVLNDINTWVKQPAKDEPDKSKWVKALNIVFGKAATYDVKKSKYFYERETEDRVNEFKAAIKKAVKLGDEEHAKKLQEELKTFRKERSL